MKKQFITLIIIFLGQILIAQNSEILEGTITFVTSKNAYAKFKITENIRIGDSLILKNNQKKCLVVINKSSSSVVCKRLENCDIKKGDLVVYTIIQIKKDKERPKIVFEQSEAKPKKVIQDKKKKELEHQRISGRFVVASYNTFSNVRNNSSRFSSTLSLNIDHINDSKFSFETFINYRKIFDAQLDPSRETSFFRIFNTAVKYEPSSKVSVIVGRHINPRAISLGAIDGVQVETHLKNISIGSIVGFRPDLMDYGFNSGLLQYGVYFGFSANTKNINSETTIGVMEQKNQTAIDRRFVYFQHHSSLNRRTNLYSTAELDFYNPQIQQITKADNVRLTNFFTSIRYRFNRKVNASLSFDSRRQIIYYESFLTELERLITNDIARNGIIARINVRASKSIYTGFGYGKRFQNGGNNSSDNINAFVRLNDVPKIGGTAQLNLNLNVSNYMNTAVANINYSRGYANPNLYSDFYYRFLNYSFMNELIPTASQHVLGSNLNYNFSRKLIFSFTGEYAMTNTDNVSRIYARLIKRF